MSIEAATRDLSRLTKERDKAERDLVAARQAEEAAKGVYDESAKDSDLDVASKARLRTERQSRLVESAKAALRDAQLHLAALEREKLANLYQSELATLSTWTQSLDVAKLAEIDRALDAAVLAIIGRVIAAGELHDDAAAHAATLGRRDLPPRPDVSVARIVVQQHLAGLRERDGRDSLAAWVSDPPGHADWHYQGMSPQTLIENVTAAKLATEQTKHAAAVAEGVALATAAAAQPPTTPTQENPA